MSQGAVGDIDPTTIPQTLENVHTIGKSRQDGTHDTGTRGLNLFLAAPSQNVLGYNQFTDVIENWSSAAIPVGIAAASAVLLWNQFPSMTNNQIEEGLKKGATDIEEAGWDDKTGWGLLNVEASRDYLVLANTTTTSTTSATSTTTSTTSTTTATETSTTTTTSETASDDDSPVFIEVILSSFVMVVFVRKKLKSR